MAMEKMGAASKLRLERPGTTLSLRCGSLAGAEKVAGTV